MVTSKMVFFMIKMVSYRARTIFMKVVFNQEEKKDKDA